MADTGLDTGARGRSSDRRGPERRVADDPIAHEDRRTAERRSGRDRRAEARKRLV